MSCPTLLIFPASLPPAIVGTPYSQPLTTSPPDVVNYGRVEGEIQYSAKAGGSFTPSGTVTGNTSGATAIILTPGGTSGGFFFVRAISGTFIAGETITSNFPIAVSATLDSINLLPELPPGFSISNTSPTEGVLSGTPTSAGFSEFFVYAENVLQPSCDAGIKRYGFFMIITANHCKADLSIPAGFTNATCLMGNLGFVTEVINATSGSFYNTVTGTTMQYVNPSMFPLVIGSGSCFTPNMLGQFEANAPFGTIMNATFLVDSVPITATFPLNTNMTLDAIQFFLNEYLQRENSFIEANSIVAGSLNVTVFYGTDSSVQTATVIIERQGQPDLIVNASFSCTIGSRRRRNSRRAVAVLPFICINPSGNAPSSIIAYRGRNYIYIHTDENGRWCYKLQ